MTEGNDLLNDSPPCQRVRSHLDEVWYVDAEQELRMARLIAAGRDRADRTIAWS
ncbi:hypothetical protein KIH31_03980 [Paenarthrobacter sp. DKR-5]|uniref:hypothetical protein n=1 Tax=Paenarthrobacter sp. DKR-5 TaxID=2835535 RepID=UPI001BDD8B50|nr:hypothetical protein [Paenarthrobacter sp. DKR-5]MBT1001753.1 hypothetical protein [Paenarthrobacter sp. DKR-5]